MYWVLYIFVLNSNFVLIASGTGVDRREEGSAKQTVHIVHYSIFLLCRISAEADVSKSPSSKIMNTTQWYSWVTKERIFTTTTTFRETLP